MIRLAVPLNRQASNPLSPNAVSRSHGGLKHQVHVCVVDLPQVSSGIRSGLLSGLMGHLYRVIIGVFRTCVQAPQVNPDIKKKEYYKDFFLLLC